MKLGVAEGVPVNTGVGYSDLTIEIETMRAVT